MPRKMKKADKRDPFCKTKWGRKVWNYRRKHSTAMHIGGSKFFTFHS